MPAAACPGTVHLYASLPFLSVTLSVADLPGLINAVVLPPMLKS